jgi:hypothetical protein
MDGRNSAWMKAISDKPGPRWVTTSRARRGAEHSKEWNHETPYCSDVSRRLYRRLDPRLCARWWSRICSWRLRARHDTLSAADPAGAGSKPDSSSTRVTLAGTHDQWATVTARIQRPDRNRGMTPSCASRVFSEPRLPAGRGVRELALTRSARPTGKARRNKGPAVPKFGRADETLTIAKKRQVRSAKG